MAYSIHTKVRLQDKVDSAWRRLSGHRMARERIWKAYVGDTHGLSTEGAERIPLNGHALYVRSLLQYLAAHQPRPLITTDVGPWKRHMELIEHQTGRIMSEERFGFRQQRWVLDALMYSPGILKVHQEWRRIAVGDGSDDSVNVLRTAVSNVDWSDWVFDTAATSVWDAEFTGHRVRIPIEDALSNPMFEDVSADKLRGLSGWTSSEDGRLFFEKDDRAMPYRETLAVWEIFDRCRNRILIWPADGSSLTLYDEPWEGHRNGPFHYIDFLDVPNHVVGLSPLCVLHNLIEATNRALSKAIKQADAAKTVMRIVGGNKAEAQAVMEALDGQAVYQDGGGVAEMMSVGGPEARTLAMVPMLQGLYNWLGGNINELAGLGVSAPTATQGKLLSEAASGMVQFMQMRTQEAVRGAVEAIVWHELKDAVSTEVVPSRLADGETLWRRFTPEQRGEIDPLLLNVNIDVSSMRYRSPEQRLGQLMQWWTSFAVPGAQMWQQQGGMYDIQALNEIYAKYVDMPEIRDVALYSAAPMPEAGGLAGPMPLRQSPVTTRTNVRLDAPGADRAPGAEMMENLMQMEAA